MSAARVRRAKAARLALDLQAKFSALQDARDEEAVQHAAIQLGITFNTNVDFVINVLRDYGGLDPKFDAEPTASQPANDLPAVPSIFRAGCDVDMPGRKH